MKLDEAVVRVLTISDENKMVVPHSEHPWTSVGKQSFRFCH